MGAFEAVLLVGCAPYRMVHPDAREAGIAWREATCGLASRAACRSGATTRLLRVGGLRDLRGGAPLVPVYATLAFATRF